MTGPHGFINIGPTTSRRSTIDQLVDVITHLVKENQDLKETNATLIKQSIVAPGSEEHEFTWPEFPEEFDENGNRQIPDQEMYYMFDQAAEIIQRHPVFKKNYRSSTVTQVLKEEAKKWTAEKPKKQ
ncbi:hypothetical protein YH66_11925 [[Brevibacterium] flavum]|uniref:Uncharacterized protein n=1 Tax=[Brevibacterium] flavum TaxID=92706 RepID=A0A0F6WR64_9CORY|nr:MULTISPECIES: hypothetical protein [Corynebacterium]AKF28201.1 hypothetical protein YH66_11925 [[Brevibacterium] flavum]ANE09039.1 hypothetical protein A3654_11995 [Corynebacterium glutamicum]AST21449.1 hypothetical protein CEY17_12095 [Corynebacterium glutamicum ATCC 14067]KEI23977.1 hypothetical protein KIQ_015895 [Corynebacterium glutamicum ATCC 14067]KIH72996.1 hypothetical protein SD36_11980 [Corynebacterium glutamicum]